MTSGAGPRAMGMGRGRWSDLEMSDTCATHRSQVPRRRLEGYKTGATTVKDEGGPGLGFILCFGFVCVQAVVREGHDFVFILLLKASFDCPQIPASSFIISQ